MKKLIPIIFLLLFMESIQAQINAVNDNFYLRINVCPNLLTVRLNDAVNLGNTRLITVYNTVPQDIITIDTNNILLNYCYTGAYVKSRSFNYVLFDDTSGTGLGVYDTATVSIQFANIDSIYPGDYNNDGIVNNIDLLGLGYNFQNIGLYRYGGISSTYVDQYGQDWDSIQAFTSLSINSKYADFNGSGRADINDLATYYLNYSLIHKTPTPYIPTVGGPTLKLINTSLSDTFEDGATLSLDIVLGDSLNTLSNILGLAYTLDYDSTCISPNFGDTIVKVIYNPTNNFFITASNFLESNVEVRLNKTIQSAVVASNRIGAGGSGGVGSIIVVLDDYIDGNIKGPGVYPFTFVLQDIVAIDRNGTRIPIQSAPIQLYHKKTNVGIDEKACNTLEIYPNPANEQISISNTCSDNTSVEIINSIGQPVAKFSIKNGSSILPLKNINAGFYQMILKDAENTTYKKLIVRK